MIQFVSRVLPASADKTCSKCARLLALEACLLERDLGIGTECQNLFKAAEAIFHSPQPRSVRLHEEVEASPGRILIEL
jgi:hypothetical protein